MATLYPTDGPPREITPANGRSFSLEELHAIVGGYIEAFYRVPPHDGRVLFLNADGKRLELPLNRAATRLVRAHLVDDVIVGPAVVCTRREAGEDEPHYGL